MEDSPHELSALRNRAIFYIIITCFLWGILPLLLKVGTEQAGPQNIVFLRFSIACCCMIFFKFKPFKLTWNRFVLIFLGALSLSFNYFGYTMGLIYTNSSNCQIVIQSGPLLLVLLSTVIFKERLSVFQINFLILTVVGFIIFYISQKTELASDKLFLGNIWIILAGLAWALYMIFQRKLGSNLTASQILVGIFGLSSVISFPWVDMEEFQNYSKITWGLLLISGVFTAVTYYLISQSTNYISSLQISSILSLNPLLTILIVTILNSFNVAFYNYEPLSLLSYVGAALVVFGTTRINLRAKR